MRSRSVNHLEPLCKWKLERGLQVLELGLQGLLPAQELLGLE
jgi:hypothetical protein